MDILISTYTYNSPAITGSNTVKSYLQSLRITVEPTKGPS